MNSRPPTRTHIIIGGGIAGTTCAGDLAAICPDDSIIVISASRTLKIASQSVNLTRNLQDFVVSEAAASEAFKSTSNVRVVSAYVDRIDTAARIVRTSDGQSLAYHSLAICTGARPQLIASHPSVVAIRDTESVHDLSKRLSAGRRVVVVGNGGIALELVYALRQYQEVVWVVKHDFIGNTFLDRSASAFVIPFLFPHADPHPFGSERPAPPPQPSSSSAPPASSSPSPTEPVVRPMESSAPGPTIIDSDNAWSMRNPWLHAAPDPHSGSSAPRRTVGGGLGPRWMDHLAEKVLPRHSVAPPSAHATNGGEEQAIQPNIFVEFGAQVLRVFSAAPEQAEGKEWPTFVELTNGKTIGCDFVVSASGVIPNTEAFASQFRLGPDGGIAVDCGLETSVPGVFAAGDSAYCTFADPADPDSLCPHWFQMRLWSQAKQMGHVCAQAMAGALERELGCPFDLFAHSTKFFGLPVALLGRFNGQGLGVEGADYKVMVRCQPGKEFIKLVIAHGKLRGATLLGDTTLAETCENLIQNGLDVSGYGESLLDPDLDLEDYFD